MFCAVCDLNRDNVGPGEIGCRGSCRYDVRAGGGDMRLGVGRGGGIRIMADGLMVLVGKLEVRDWGKHYVGVYLVLRLSSSNSGWSFLARTVFYVGGPSSE